MPQLVQYGTRERNSFIHLIILKYILQRNYILVQKISRFNYEALQKASEANNIKFSTHFKFSNPKVLYGSVEKKYLSQQCLMWIINSRGERCNK